MGGHPRPLNDRGRDTEDSFTLSDLAMVTFYRARSKMGARSAGVNWILRIDAELGSEAVNNGAGVLSSD